jgi:uncharacterized protein
MVSVFFVDTSALAKRYITESGSVWVRSWIQPAQHNQIILAETARVEMASLLGRHARSGNLTQADANRLQRTFMRHFQSQYVVIKLSTPILKQGSAITMQHGLRTLDAIQLASALKAQKTINAPIIFISADANLLTAAATEGFAVDNPLNHP